MRVFFIFAEFGASGAMQCSQPLSHSQAAESFSGMMAGVRVEELIGDVSENGRASRRDAAFGDQSEESGEELAEIDGRRDLGELREQVGGEVFRIVIQLQGSGGFGQAEMVRTKAEVRLRASEAATHAVGVAIETTSGIVQGNAGRFRESRDAGVFLGWVHDVPYWGYPRAICMNIKRKDLRNLHFVNA
jgi:hypothetical protein